jgi:mono/diheme cytochrome c family protein
VAAPGLRVLTALALLIGPASAQPVGQQLYEENCGGCHGLNLEGQPDWMKRLPSGKLPPPPHDETGHTWHHTDEQLTRITLDGLAALAPGYETDMPAYRGKLTEDQVKSILDYIKSTWPERIQKMQELRSRKE